MAFHVLDGGPEEEEWVIPKARAPRPRPSALFDSVGVSLAGASRSGRRGRIATPSPSASARKVVVKARVVRAGDAKAAGAAAAHVRYLEREGVELGGGQGELYDRSGPVDADKACEPLDGEKHQFRLIISPEDGHELDLQDYVRRYMQRVEQDVGRKLVWAAVNHHNTDSPHAHVIIRGVDADGDELRLDRQYVSHGLRHRAQELATQLLGPRPEHSRAAGFRRQLDAHGFTGLDWRLGRHANEAGVIDFDELRQHRYPDELERAALHRRALALARMGLAQERGPEGKGRAFALHPEFKQELQKLERREEALAVLGRELEARPEMCRVLDKRAAKDALPSELSDATVLVRWKGLDDAGGPCVAVETAGGAAVHLPVNNRAFAELRVGRAAEISVAGDKDEELRKLAEKDRGRLKDSELTGPQRRRLAQLERLGLASHRMAKTPDKGASKLWLVDFDRDAKIDQVARQASGPVDATMFGKHTAAFVKRLEHLERLRLAEREPDRQAWTVQQDLAQELEQQRERQPAWQWLSVRAVPQSLTAQRRFRGPVWLDRVEARDLAETGFGRKLRDHLKARRGFLSDQGLEPDDAKLRWKLVDAQRDDLARALAQSSGKALWSKRQARGQLKLHEAENGQHFIEISDERKLAVLSLPFGRVAKARELEGKQVTVSLSKETGLTIRLVANGQGLDAAAEQQRAERAGAIADRTADGQPADGRAAKDRAADKGMER